MAAELQRTFPNQAGNMRLIPSGGGVFEVRNGDQLVFSKKQLGRFPNEGEIAQKLRG